MKKNILFIILGVLLYHAAFSHSGKPKFHVIIDTDGAADDMRAITMLLASHEVRVLAITCSDGSQDVDSVLNKVKSLLSVFNHHGIRVGKSEKHTHELPMWTDFASKIIWSEKLDTALFENYNSLDLIDNIIKNYNTKIYLIALGSLKTFADYLQKNQNYDKIEKIIWYNAKNITEGHNYKISPESFDYIKNSELQLEILSINEDAKPLNQKYIEYISKTNSNYARQIDFLLKQKDVINRINNKHLYLWDDLIPLYLNLPMLFEKNTEENINYVTLLSNIPEEIIYESISNILISASQTNNRVFNTFPLATELYKKEYSDILQQTTEKYGLIEWKAVCLTNEVHGHTGIYSIIGAKMGIRAMEFFNVGINNLAIVTYAGNYPPISCLNDGIQISTGATIGQGLIEIADSVYNIPTADFSFNKQTIRISLKPEIATKMKTEISYGVKNYGLESDKYWLYIEELAIKYWAEFNRNDIFKVEKINN